MKNAKLITTLALVWIAWQAAADEPSPVGRWAVQNGEAHIRILRCDGALWGVIDWLQAPGMDENNPDAAKRDRSLLGLPILKDMKPEGDRWGGSIYNSENGKTYNGTIRLEAPDRLYIEGCLLGWLCGGEDWKRLDAVINRKEDKALCRKITEY